jgi:hypothetical protein
LAEIKQECDFADLENYQLKHVIGRIYKDQVASKLKQRELQESLEAKEYVLNET